MELPEFFPLAGGPYVVLAPFWDGHSKVVYEARVYTNQGGHFTGGPGGWLTRHQEGYLWKVTDENPVIAFEKAMQKFNE